MEGAADRAKNERANVWWSAMMGRMEKPPTFEAFTGHKPDRSQRIAQFIAAWDEADKTLRANR